MGPARFHCASLLLLNKVKKGNVDCLRSPLVRQCTEKDRVRFLTLRYWVKSSTRVFLRWYAQSRVIAGYPQTLNAITSNVTITDTWQPAGLTENV